MEIHNLAQGSDAWHQFRLEHFGASEAAAMLGLSKMVKRTELLHMKHTGTAKEFSDWVQKNILDYGHEVEALARPIIEEQIGEDLYPVTCSDGRISASVDGLTMSEEIAWEHKQWNEELAGSVAAGIVPDTHMPQCQQELMVTKAKKLIFTVSDGTREKMVSTEVLPSQEWFDRLRAGWAQFEKDLAEYQPVEYAEKPTADTIMQLPALAIQIRGEVVLSNLPQFKAAATAFIEGIKVNLETDDDFANAEANVKFCEKVEKDLELTKAAALSQTASIDELMRTIDFIQSEMRAKRLMLSKLVTNKKAAIKEEVLMGARNAYAAYLAELEAEIKPVRLDIPGPDFIGAAKNKRTLASLNDAVDTELANGKIAADAAAKKIRANLAWYHENAAEYTFLFADLGQLAAKDAEHFELVVKTRIDQHKLEEQRKEEARKAAAAAITHAAAPAQAPAPVPVVGEPAPTIQAAKPAPATSSPPELRLGQIGDRLGFSLTADFLRTLGFEPAGRDRAAVLYHQHDFDRMCVALMNHIVKVRGLQQQAA